MKRYVFIIIVIVAVAIFVFLDIKLGITGLFHTMSAEELKDKIEITDVDTVWVKKYYQAWPPKLTLVPAISFRVKNISSEPLKYINFNANFRFKDDYENLGDCFLAAIRSEPVMPGEKSDVILLQSNYGVEGKTLNSFKNNPNWKTVFVKLFAQSKGSQFALLGQWEVSKKIDFKEPEPVAQEEKKLESSKEKKKEFD